VVGIQCFEQRQLTFDFHLLAGKVMEGKWSSTLYYCLRCAQQAAQVPMVLGVLLDAGCRVLVLSFTVHIVTTAHATNGSDVYVMPLEVTFLISRAMMST
jgi:hypothetical protein